MSLFKGKYISSCHDYLLSAEGEEKVDQRSVVGMSQNANAFTLTLRAVSSTNKIFTQISYLKFTFEA
jgi:hypothetical protein